MPPLELYLLTFNCARTLVDISTLGPRFFDAYPRSSGLPDLVAVSLQEIAPIAQSFLGESHLQPYYERLTDALRLAAVQRGGDPQAYETVISKNVGMTAVMLFAKAEIASHIEWKKTAHTGVGLWDMGNKGAVGVNLRYRAGQDAQTLDLTFIAAHLAPHEESVSRRNQDWKNIVQNLVFRGHDAPSGRRGSEESEPLLSNAGSNKDGTTPSTLYQNEGYIFVAGDFNYRTSDVSPQDDSHLTYPQPGVSEDSSQHINNWLKHDQLSRELNAGRTFHGFQERPITFQPTYKYSEKAFVNTAGVTDSSVTLTSAQSSDETWMWATHRFPSWCDRILYLNPPSNAAKLEFHKYTSLPLQRTSDHQPVALSLTIDIKSAPPGPRDGDVHDRSPFQVNPSWESRQNAARQKEILVGLLAYATLERKGQAITVTTAFAVFVAWYIFGGSYSR